MATSTPTPPGGAFVLPPGQEDLVAEILGRGEALPGDCRLQAASIEGDRVLARYACAGREVELSLLHPSVAPAGAVQAGSVAVVAAPAAPRELVSAVAARARDRGGALAWSRPAAAPGDATAPGGAPSPRTLERWAAPAAGAAIAVACLVLLAVARRRLASRLPAAGRPARRWAAPLAALATCAAVHLGLRGLGLVLEAPLAPMPILAFAAGAALAVAGSLAASAGTAALGARASRRAAAGLLSAVAAAYLAAGLWLSLRPPPERGFAGLALRRGTEVERSPRRPRVTYRTNHLGFREPDFPEARPAGALRIALVGDSYVFGSGIEVDGTLSSRLAGELEGRGGRRAEVLNLGVPGNNLHSHVDLALAASERLGADVVVLCLTLANDLSRWDAQDERREASRPGLYGLAQLLLGHGGASVLWNLVLLDREVTPEGLAELRRQLARLSVLRGRPSPRLVFFHYTPREPEVDAVLREWSEAAVVAPPAFEAGEFIPGDGHPTAAGNRRFAALLAAELERQGVVGARR